ncbi:MAG: S-layer homology domain-containing protein, partial [Ruminiclostridium sp.]|nr:S-layer homology domain-containing protein [Ruminiclostridium sp.]
MKKRVLSMAMALVMMISLFPTTTFAASMNPFSDVNSKDWFYNEVLYVKDKGLMNGTSDSAFNPTGTTTRGMIVTILHRLTGEPAAPASTFQDVDDSQYYADAVDWAAANGVVTGYSTTAFGPNDFITREQLATIFYRYASLMGYDVSVGEDTNILSYSDALSVSPYAVSAMQWAVGADLVNGSDGKLSPQGLATRAQVAAILYRFCTQVVEDVTPVAFTVTLVLNDGTNAVYKTITVEEGKTITAPQAPSRSGYTFAGWSASAANGKLFDFSQPITGNLILFAQWSEAATHSHSYTVVNNENGTHSKICRCDRVITEACNDRGENGACSVCGNTDEYAATADQLAEAIAEGGTVKLTEDITLPESLTVSQDTTLDLNGQTLTGEDGVYPVVRVQDGANVTVKDSSGSTARSLARAAAQNGTITHNDYLFVLGSSDGTSSGNLTIESGSYHGATSVASVTKGTLTITGGSFSADPYNGSYAYLLNCIDANYKNGTANIVVKGGSFQNFDPANNASEGPGTNLVVPGYISEESSGTWTVRAVDKNNITSAAELAAAIAAGGSIKLAEDISLTQPLTVSQDTTLDLNGKTITGTDGIYPVVRVQDDANVTVKNGSITNDDYVFVLGSSDGTSSGNLTIESGTYHGATSVASVTKGTLTITGGSFSVTPYGDNYNFLLNCIDANYADGTANIVVKGGSFEKFNPANNASEGPGTNLVAPGY